MVGNVRGSGQVLGHICQRSVSVKPTVLEVPETFVVGTEELNLEFKDRSPSFGTSMF